MLRKIRPIALIPKARPRSLLTSDIRRATSGKGKQAFSADKNGTRVNVTVRQNCVGYSPFRPFFAISLQEDTRRRWLDSCPEGHESHDPAHWPRGHRVQDHSKHDLNKKPILEDDLLCDLQQEKRLPPTRLQAKKVARYRSRRGFGARSGYHTGQKNHDRRFRCIQRCDHRPSGLRGGEDQSSASEGSQTVLKEWSNFMRLDCQGSELI
jgi:hypothetical protein